MTLPRDSKVALLRAADGVRRRMAGVLADAGLTLQQYNVLRILRGARPDPLPTLEIADRMIERTPGITRLLDGPVEASDRGAVAALSAEEQARLIELLQRII